MSTDFPRSHATRSGRPAVLIALILSGVSFAGCIGEELVAGSGSPDRMGTPVSLVAVLEGAVQPYHETFRVDPHADAAFEAFGRAIGAETLDLTFSGTFEENLAADAAVWASTRQATLYRVAGTRLFLSAFDPPLLVQEGWNYTFLVGGDHSAGVAASAYAEVPTTAVLVVQTNFVSYIDKPGPEPDRLLLAKSFLRAMRWLSEYPSVDVVSVSAGFPGNPPDGDPAMQDFREFNDLTRALVADGKIVVFAAGNDPTPPILGALSGPHWIVNVGGVEGRGGGNDPLASKGPDFVQNMTVVGPDGTSTNGTNLYSGTSFAAPAVAGRFAQVIAGLRAAADVAAPRTEGPWFVPPGALGPAGVGPWEVRAAFNATATLWEVGDWGPRSTDMTDFLYNSSIPVAPVVPAAQLGWGYVGAEEAEAALALLLEYARTGNRALLDPPAAKGANVAFMEATYAARQAYWDAKSGG